MPAAHKPISFTPKDGGKLATDISLNEVGLQNYRLKRDWRRFLDREMRREGDDYFRPNLDAPSGNLVPYGAMWVPQTETDYYYLVDGFTVGHTYIWALGNAYELSAATAVGNGRLFPSGTIYSAGQGSFVATQTSYYLWMAGDGGTAPLPITALIFEFLSQLLNAPEPVTLVHLARSQQKSAVIAGTPSTLYRFFTTGEGDYVSDVAPFDYWGDYADAGYVLTSSVSEPYAIDYFAENEAGWQVIGSGFSTHANRWEAVNLGGDVVFNNGVDLPVAYRLNEFEVVPLYELRENGVLAVGTITQINDVLLLADIAQAKETAFQSLFDQVAMAGTAHQTGVTTVPGTASQVLGSLTVTIDSGAFTFDAGMIGKTFRFRNGFSREITGVTDATHATLAAPAPAWSETYDGNLGLAFEILNAGNVDSIVTATNGVFTSDMVGLRLFWDSGEVRTIQQWLSPTQVVVETDYPIADGIFTLENKLSYGIVTDPSMYDRIRYRVINSALGDARRYNAEIPASIEAGSRQLTFDFPTRSFKAGMEVLVTDAGLNGGNLLANIIFVGAGGKYATLDRPALATTELINTALLAYDFETADFLEVPVIEGETYRFTPAANDSYLLNGAETVGSGKFIAAGDTVKIYGVQPADLVVDGLTYNDDADPFVQIDVVAGQRYRYVPGANEDHLENGDVRLAATTFTATQSVVRIVGTTASVAVTASLIPVSSPVTASLVQISVNHTLVQAADMVGSIVGFQDLEQDGSRIIRMLDLNDRLVLYRETGYQIGQYTGITTEAFYFSQMVKTANSLYYKYTLISVTYRGINFHLYAGRNNFYRFDMTTRLPVSVPELEICQNVFFRQGDTIAPDSVTPVQNYPPPFSALYIVYSGLIPGLTYQWKFGDTVETVTGVTSKTFIPQYIGAVPEYGLRRVISEDSNLVFSAENEMTREIFICFPSDGEDKALCFDYDQGTVSTTSAFYTAAATVIKPGEDDQKWFAMGTLDGQMLMYGLVDVPQPNWSGKAIYSRRGNPYTSDLWSGMGHLGIPFHEKAMNGYVLELSTFSPDTVNVTVSIYGATNPNTPTSDTLHKAERLLGTRVLTVNKNLFPVHFLTYYYSDRIVIEGKDNPCEITQRTYNLSIVKSASQTRWA